MVRLAYAAINAFADGDEEQQGVETLEAQEARVANTYMRALQLVQDERKEEAKVCLIDACVAESDMARPTAPVVPFHTLDYSNLFYCVPPRNLYGTSSWRRGITASEL